MAERMHRTQILLEPQQQQALAELAHQEGRSISDLVREMIRHQLEHRQQVARAAQEQQLAALERIRQHREAILTRRGGTPVELDVVALIHQLREDQDERNLASSSRARP